LLSKLYNALSVFAIATLLAGGGLSAYLLTSGKVTAERVEKIAGVLRGEYDEDPAADAPDEAGATEQDAPPRAPSTKELRDERRAGRLQRAALERSKRDLTAQAELLKHAMHDLIQRQERLDSDRTTWREQMAKLTDSARDEGFQRELTYVSKLAPKQAKEHLVRTWNKHKADAVRLLNALNTSTGQRILEQMKSPEEIQIVHELLEQLRLMNLEELAPGSGKTEGA